MSAVDLLAPPDPATVANAVALFAAAIRKEYGNCIKGVYLFGSRARGDFDPYSDADIAIILDDSIGRTSQTKPLAEIAYDIFLRTGTEIQPWVFPEAEWSNPQHSSAAGLIRAVRRDGLPF